MNVHFGPAGLAHDSTLDHHKSLMIMGKEGLGLQLGALGSKQNLERGGLTRGMDKRGGECAQRR